MVIQFSRVLAIFFLVIFGCTSKDKTTTQIAEDATQMESTTEDEIVFNGPCVFERKENQTNKFPFDKTYKVELVSYECRKDSYSNDTLIRNDKFIVENIKQRVSLGKSQRDSIFSILYNLRPSPAGRDTLQADCYNPRHSIVFYEKAKAVAFLEICFECGGTRQSPNVDFGQFCPEKRCVLQKFFKTNGVSLGIIDELCE